MKKLTTAETQVPAESPPQSLHRSKEICDLKRTVNLFGPCILAAAILAPLAGTGCAARVRMYDEDHRDYHRWDDREDRAYRRYLSEKHEEYREFSQRNNAEQRDYWNWRHTHPDADR